jgi:hypothetical protein
VTEDKTEQQDFKAMIAQRTANRAAGLSHIVFETDSKDNGEIKRILSERVLKGEPTSKEE